MLEILKMLEMLENLGCASATHSPAHSSLLGLLVILPLADAVAAADDFVVQCIVF